MMRFLSSGGALCCLMIGGCSFAPMNSADVSREQGLSGRYVTSSSRQTVQLVDGNGDAVTSYVIALAHDATPPERHAAEELAGFLAEVTGAAFPIKTPEEAGDAPCLAVGPGAAKALEPGLALEGLGTDGIVIRQHSGNGASPSLILTGGAGASRGTLYAVYTFLEDHVGCRWWSRSESSIPGKPTLSIPAGLDIRYVPPLERRDQCFVEGLDKDWSVRMKYNGWCGPGNDVARGRSLEYAGPNSHTFYRLVPPAQYFEEHPEWFSEIEGARVNKDGQLCLTNPELVRFVIGRIKEWLRKNPNAAYVSVSQNDSDGWCTCAKCKAVDAEEGGHSGTMIRFANAVAEGIEDEYPDVAVDTFAYRYTRKPPKHAKPRKNVVVRLCTIECNFARPLKDESNKAFREDLEGWARICDRLYIWDYVTNFRHYLQPHPNLRVLGPNIRFFVKHNVKGVFEQGNYQSPGGEFAVLRAWMMGKLLWNPKLDDRAVLNEFLEGYYGPAAPWLRNYISLIHDAAEEADCTMTCYAPSSAPYLAPGILSRAAEFFERASAAVAGQPEYLRRVELAEMPVLYALLDKEYSRFLMEGRLANEDAFFARLDRCENIARNENISHITELGPRLGPDEWARFVRRVTTNEDTEQASWTAGNAKGDIAVIRLPAFWKFAPDPEDAGVGARWFAEDFDDGTWATNRNDVECGWERQGCPSYTGSGWYRQKFDLPADLKNKHLYVYFKAVAGEARVHLNGRVTPAFERTCASTKLAPEQMSKTPFLFDATDELNAGGSNLLAVRVRNFSDRGGVWRPVYVIAADMELTLDDARDAILDPIERTREKLAAARKETPRAEAVERKNGDFTLDGKLDKPFWIEVPEYQMTDLVTGKPPNHGTTFKVAWSDGNILFGIRCEETDMKGLNVATEANDDFNLWNGDAVEILIETQYHSYYQLAVNPAGAMADLDRRGGEIERAWSSGADVAAYRGHTFWSVEVRIPLRDDEKGMDTLRGARGRKPSPAEPWYFNVCRQRVREGVESDAFSPTGTRLIAKPAKFATLIVR